MASETCPFCQSYPYHEVDNGVGTERVAVVCCDLGQELHSSDCREGVAQIANRIFSLTGARTVIDDLIEETREQAAAIPPRSE